MESMPKGESRFGVGLAVAECNHGGCMSNRYLSGGRIIHPDGTESIQRPSSEGPLERHLGATGLAANEPHTLGQLPGQ